ncbi:translation initiation factor IF-2-like [Panicum virgatum]|uniref:translation initiation factor IF-2-like n=1 Tax=Panicum virgatum TaxID=38727 RepID=UPI0019D59915|nr:translation initiation factor IF-2-like [Panicum virgatum]
MQAAAPAGACEPARRPRAPAAAARPGGSGEPARRPRAPSARRIPAAAASPRRGLEPRRRGGGRGSRRELRARAEAASPSGGCESRRSWRPAGAPEPSSSSPGGELRVGCGERRVCRATAAASSCGGGPETQRRRRRGCEPWQRQPRAGKEGAGPGAGASLGSGGHDLR